MLKIALLGAGSHSEHVHGPSLARLAQARPGEVELAAVCDLRKDRAELFRREFGFRRAYTDLDQMLAEERPDACWVVTPIELTRELAGRVIEAGVPTLLEKPPGVSLEEARELAEVAARARAPAMVAFNRRWASPIKQALAWVKEYGPFEYAFARMLRTRRLDERFAYGTGIHLLDCLRALGEAALGPMRAARTVRTAAAAGRYSFHVDLSFGEGRWGRCDILPTCGAVEESYALYGRDRMIVAALPWVMGGGRFVPGRAELWLDGKPVEEHAYEADPLFLHAGFYGEAEEFAAALLEGRRPSPSPQEALSSVALAEAVQEGREVEFG